MAVVSSVTLNKEGHPTTGAGDVLVGDRAEHVENLVHRLANIARSAGADLVEAAEEIRSRAEAIVDAHRVVAPGEVVPAVEVPDPPAAESPAAEPGEAG